MTPNGLKNASSGQATVLNWWRATPNANIGILTGQESGLVVLDVDPRPIFVTSPGNRLGARKLSGYHFKRIVAKAGVPDIRFHDIRHTFASWFMIKNDDIWTLKGILGHADVQTTQRYAHLSSRFQKVPSFGWEAMAKEES